MSLGGPGGLGNDKCRARGFDGWEGASHAISQRIEACRDRRSGSGEAGKGGIVRDVSIIQDVPKGRVGSIVRVVAIVWILTSASRFRVA